MEMDAASPAFKTQWLNETLKFIKNDEELIYKYPEWPISHVTFYHAIIVQRQLSVGLGFKTLYAPLWEAMRVFGLKYTFKVTIVNSKDEGKGSLVLEKIPKKTEEDNDTDSEEDECKHKLTKKAKQAYLINKAIVERNSPTFIKNTLKSLLGFIIDEASASIDFKDLAPIEAKFIQNIQAIHDQKFLLYKIFTPSAIELLKKISSSLNSFKNTYSIKVGNVKTHPKTAKRQITLTKEPNFGLPPSSSLPSSTSPTKKSKSKLKAPAPLRTPKSLNPKPIPTFECVSSSINHNDVAETKLKETDTETLNCKGKTEEQQSSHGIETFENKNGTKAKSHLINVDSISSSEAGKENASCNANKTVLKVDSKIDDKNNGNKSLKVPGNEVKSTEPIPVKVAEKSKDSVPGGKLALTRSAQKKAIMEAMSRPLESDRGLRMMKMMGWEGGALGLRGNGIVEPIMPALHLKPKAGLGAPPAKMSDKQNKREPKTKKGAKETKTSSARRQFLEGAHEALLKGGCVVHFRGSLSARETKAFVGNILDLNRRARVSHNGPHEKSMVDQILDKLNAMPDKIFDYSFMHNASDLCLRVIKKTDDSTPQPIAPKAATESDLPGKLLDIDNYLRSKTGKPRKIYESISRLSVKLYTLVTVAGFVEGDDLAIDMDFTFGYSKKVFKYMQRICEVLNDGKCSSKIKSCEEVALLNRISASLKSSFLLVHLISPHVTVRKIKLVSKHRQMIDYTQFFNIPLKDKTSNEIDASDSESDNENKAKVDKNVEKKIIEASAKLDGAINSKAKINKKVQKKITEPNNSVKPDEPMNCKVKVDDKAEKRVTGPDNSVKPDETINCKAKIDDNVEKKITEPSNSVKFEAINCKANIDDKVKKLVTEPKNGEKVNEAINCKAKIDDNVQKLNMEPINGKKLDEAKYCKAKVDDKKITEPSQSVKLEAINCIARIDDKVEKLVTKPRNGKKVNEAITCKAKIDDNVEKQITERSNSEKLEAINCKAKIDDEVKKLVTDPRNGKKVNEAINCKAKIDDNVEKEITESISSVKLEAINCKAKIDDKVKKLVTEPKNGKKVNEPINCKAKVADNVQNLNMEANNSKKDYKAINCKAKIDDNVQKLITEPINGMKLDEAKDCKAKVDDNVDKKITEPSKSVKLEAINCIAKIDEKVEKLVTKPRKGKKVNEAINSKGKIDDNVEKEITEPSSSVKLEAIDCNAKIDEKVKKLVTEPKNGKKVNEPINCKAKIDDNVGKKITEPSNGKKLDEAKDCKAKVDDNVQKLITKPSNDKNLDEAISLIKNVKLLQDKDIDEKIIEKGKESIGPESQRKSDKNCRYKFSDLIQEILNDDVNDNVLNSDISSVIKSTSQSCDTNSLKNNIDGGEAQKYSIEVLEYKEYSIVKIVIQDWKNLEKLSGKIQENIMNSDYFFEHDYLKCHGIQDGGLVYFCSNGDWFKDILSKHFNANYISKTLEIFKMKVHINSFIKVEDVLRGLEMHNRELYTTEWTVIEKGNCYFVVDVDCNSFRFICDQHFSLFAGIDTAFFTIVL